MTNGYLFRDAKKGDEQSVLSVVERVLTGFNLPFDPAGKDKDLCDIETSYFSNGGWLGVVEYAGQVIGSAGIYRLNEQVCELRKMYLLPGHQGKGLGKKLLELAMDNAGKLGFREMSLESHSSLKKANALYRKYGFVESFLEHTSARCDYAMKKIL